MIQTRGTDLWERDPVRTEVETFLALKRLENDPSVTYLALPWAPWINGSARIPKLEQLKGKAFTVCQHIRFREITRMLADAGVETLFTPHATRSEPYINGVRILGLPHFPVAFKEQEPDPDILFSFLGAPTARVRRDIVAKFGGPHVAMRDRWHFEIPSEQRVKEKGEYADVMSRSRFALCPKGTGPSSLRIWEAIAARVIPVVLADDLRLPIGIDWESCSIQIEEDRVDDIPPMLAGISAEKYAELREGVRAAAALLSGSFAFPILRWLDYGKHPVFMTAKERLLIERHLHPKHACLEWGAGGSTLHFSQLVRRYVSIEHDPAWHIRLSSLAPPAELILSAVSHRGGPGDPVTFEDYIKTPANLGEKFDRILIDGRCRVKCAMQVVESNLLAPGG